MKAKVHVVTKSGKIQENLFNEQTDAINFARQRSLDNLCAIMQSEKALSFYQFGDLVTDQAQVRDITELVQEIGAREATRAVQDGKKSLGK